MMQTTEPDNTSQNIEQSEPSPSAEPSATHFIRGNDVSSSQPNWTPGPLDSFVFIKSTEGRTYQNPEAHKQAERARTAGLVVGWYHFLWPRYNRGKQDGSVTSGKVVSGTPEEQAAFFTSHTPAGPHDLLVVDWEHAGSFTNGHEGGYASDHEKDRFIAEVKRLRPQSKVGLYVNRSMWNASNKHAGDFLWIAEYTSAPTIAEQWTFWQYSDHTTDHTPLDQNYAHFATTEALNAWITNSQPDLEEEIMSMSDQQKTEFANLIADAVLSRDGHVVNTFTGNTANHYVTTSTALEFTGRELNQIRDDLTKIKAQLKVT